LRQGVKWHDGKPFTAGDVKCNRDMLTGRVPPGCASILAILVREYQPGDDERRFEAQFPPESAHNQR